MEDSYVGRGAQIRHLPDVDDDLNEPSSRDTWFDPFRFPKSESGRALIGEVLHQVRNYKRFLCAGVRERSLVRNFEAAVTAIISGLVHFHLTCRSGGLYNSLNQPNLIDQGTEIDLKLK
jgi:hypothetical protein